VFLSGERSCDLRFRQKGPRSRRFAAAGPTDRTGQHEVGEDDGVGESLGLDLSVGVCDEEGSLLVPFGLDVGVLVSLGVGPGDGQVGVGVGLVVVADWLGLGALEVVGAGVGDPVPPPGGDDEREDSVGVASGPETVGGGVAGSDVVSGPVAAGAGSTSGAADAGPPAVADSTTASGGSVTTVPPSAPRSLPLAGPRLPKSGPSTTGLPVA
jgi:hypothetical protein